jgi:putative membrane protein
VICYYCRKTLALLTASDWVKAFCLGFFGNAVYYVLLTKGVRLAGVPTSGMLMALIPLNVALLTNRPGAETTVVVPWRRLSLPLAMILVGLWIGNIDEFSEISVATSSAEYWLGFLCSFGAMALWTWFPIRNSQWLLKHPNVSPLAWTTAQGASMLPATLLCYVAVNFETFLHGGAVLGPTPVKFVLLMVVAGLVCGWAGMALWNMMSARLPVALSGQMIVFETIFSVIYSLIYKQQAPKWTLVVGVFLLLGGVLLSLKVFRDSGRKVS